jgi:hypothetical protein
VRKADSERGASPAIELAEVEPVDVLLHEERRAHRRDLAGVERAHDSR